ncbi:hypothetical protein [Roseomonas marmotae]|uniref:YMGG-like Gly-zipper domain-containing protein n=1 Tax=Roseomonas marmotae TaxID=2768161 RepID=A0ABS3KBP1_9PROT|nr:hypothetical protein [Roseomonas marmotae]MBO1074891.1 hypothetical protein [Roseomonas marmotae]QTI80607.1 hypothetical protein IAI58_07725 [Roseomonas marmotae]
MKTLSRIAVVGTMALALMGCDNMSRSQQRALSGGAIGAAAGTAVSAIAGGSLLTGALVGGAGGAVIGAVSR